MNVSFFSNQFADKRGHGLARYSRKLFQALSDIESDLQITPVAAWSSMDEPELHRLQLQTGLRLLPWGRRLTPLAWNFFNTPPIEHWLPETDVVHAVAMGYPVATRKPLVVTVHDLGPLTHPEYLGNTAPWIMQRSLAQTVRQADAIICVSASTANELISYAGGEVEGRIQVVPEGVAPEFFQQVDLTCLEGMSNLPEPGTPFILATGKISPRKNIHGLIQAVHKLRDVLPHHLVLVGGNGWGMEEVQSQLEQLDMTDRVHFIGYVTDEQLRALYGAASVYVHPSFYEGFGLTVLEAMAAGCPVVTSNVYSLPEVAGDAALLVDPLDIKSLTDSIEGVCMNAELAAALKTQGKERAKSFRWERCAQQVCDVYTEHRHK